VWTSVAFFGSWSWRLAPSIGVAGGQTLLWGSLMGEVNTVHNHKA
jgi:hypothetical protein